jgi:ATP-dependent RNA helicase DeaD
MIVSQANLRANFCPKRTCWGIMTTTNHLERNESNLSTKEIKDKKPKKKKSDAAGDITETPAVVATEPAAPEAKEVVAALPDAVQENTDASAEQQAEETETPPDGAAFSVLGLSEAVVRGVIDAGFEAPTPIQEQAIPILLQGHDLIGQAQTGTGKTAAFALPLADRIDPTSGIVQAIVLLPTRELCIQVAQETYTLTKHRRLRVVPVYGGQPIDRQFRALMNGPQVVVGTPGRVLDHLRRGTLKLDQIKFVVLDEADEMLNMGFIEDVEEILKDAPKERQTALFSATMPPRIAALARDYLRDPQRVAIESKKRTVAQITQTFYEVMPSQKVEALVRILDHETPGSTIIFCRTRREVDELGEVLQLRGYQAETLHGELNQPSRDRVMNRFRSGQADLLIATDVAARGLDIDQVTHVINYDIPWDAESYIHRIGRTGRAGRSGEAITLISPRERWQLRTIERQINAPIKPARLPSAADIAHRRRELFKDNLRKTLQEANSDGFLMTVEELVNEGDFDAAQVAAAAMLLLWQAQKSASEYSIEEAQADDERAEPGMTRLFLQVGRMDGVRPGDIVGAIANEAGVSGNAIGAIDIMDRSTFVEVPEGDAQRVIEALANTKIRGRRVNVDIARPRRDDATEFLRREPNTRPEPRGRGGYGGRNDRDRQPPPHMRRGGNWPDRPDRAERPDRKRK